MNIKGIFKNISILMTGTVIAQLIPILMSPILTRLYSPSEFGMLAVFMSCASILAVFANLRMDAAIMSANDAREKIVLRNISLFATFILTVGSFLILIIFAEFFKELFLEIDYKLIIMFVPLFFILFGIMQLSTYISNDKEQYSLISKSKIDKNLSMTSIQIILGLLKTGVVGLIIGAVTSLIFPIYRLRKGLFNRNESSNIGRNEYKDVLKKYKKYPLLSTGTAAMDKIATEVPILIMSKYQDSILVGFYELSRRTILLPLSFVSVSVSQVYLKQITEEKSYSKNLKLTVIILIVLSIISCIVATVFLIWGELLFGIIFGEEWRIVGEYSKILIFPFLIRFIVSPLSVVFLKPENITLGGIWQLIYMITSLAIALVFLPKGMIVYLKAFAVSEVIVYILYLVMIFFALKRTNKRSLKCVE